MPLPSERRRPRWRPTPDTALALTALVLAAGGGGYALGAAGEDQVITACLDPATNQPAKIITTGSCAGGQTAVVWNQSGPKGPSGATGSEGATGSAGPAGLDAVNDQTVVALPPKPTLRRRRTFSVSLQLTDPGTYAIDGHVDWTRGKIGSDVPINCQIARTQPATVLDTLTTKVVKDDPFGFSSINESALTTVTKPAPTQSNGTVIQLPVPVTVTFTCTAQTKYANQIIFRDWTLTATPVKVSKIQKKS
jgi:hypothetical protein